MQTEQARKWYESGMAIANGYADKLDDKINDRAYSEYFYTLLFFAGDNGTGPVSPALLKYAQDILSKRRVNISSSSPLKELLGTFISISAVMFANEKMRDDACQTLQANGWMPNVADVLGKRIGLHFVSGRYDEKVSKRMHVDSRSALNAFQQLNWKVMTIGEWFYEQRENAEVFVSGSVFVISGLIFLVAMFSMISQMGWLGGIVSTVILGVVQYYATGLSILLFSFLAKFIFLVMCFVFRNIWTLMFTIGLTIYHLCF